MSDAQVSQEALVFMYLRPQTMPAISNTEWVYSTEIFF